MQPRTSEKIRILGIAPYEGMKQLMEIVAKRYPRISLTAYVGDLQKGAAIAKQQSTEAFDIILSRGQTAQLIREIATIPVVEISLSTYDILRVLKLLDNYPRRYALIGFPNITSNAHLLCDILKYEIDIFTVHREEEIQPTLQKLKDDGYQAVLCDVVSSVMAKKMGLNAFLITSGVESIAAALETAIQHYHDYSRSIAEKQMLRNLLASANEKILVMDSAGSILFSTVDQEETKNVSHIVLSEVGTAFNQKTHKFFKNIEGELYSFSSLHLTFLDRPYVAFFYSVGTIPIATTKYGIQYSNLKEAEDIFFNSFFNITSANSSLRPTIRNVTRTGLPVMITGESGTGKEQVARRIYSESPLSGNPLITINCSLINERSWNFLTNNYNSPFNDNNNTIFLKEINELSPERRGQLLSNMIDTNLTKRNRIIISCTASFGQGLPKEIQEFVDLLSCVTIHLPSLREHSSEIPSLCSLYLNNLNLSLENQVIGLEEQALFLLQEYEWPHNYTQFKRFLGELALAATTPYISAEEVARLLKEEQKPHQNVSASAKEPPKASSEGFRVDLTKSLNEINQDIVRHVLDSNEGNQTKAAKQLGIGRSTLWRYLKITD